MMRALKLAICGLVVAVSSAIFAPAAQAAPTRLPTAFNANQHIYVMPGANVTMPSNFEQMLVAEAAQQNLQVYVVFTLEGDEALSSGFADQCLTKVLNMWSAQQGFPSDTYLVIVAVQDKQHSTNWDYAGAVGAKPFKLGMTRLEVQNQLDKNKASLALDPAGFALYSVKDINARIAELKNGGGDNPPPPPKPADNKTWLIVGGIVLVLVVGGFLIFIMVRRKQKEEAHKNALAKLAAVDKLKDEVETAKHPLASSGLSFTPFQPRLSEAENTASQARSVLDRDPEKAERLAIDAESGLTSLLSDLRRAVELKNDTSLDREIADAEKKIGEQRGQEVVWNYPGLNASEHPKQRFLLNEAGNNPDDSLGQARSEKAAILSALNAGNVSEADRHFNASHSAVRSVYETIARTLACKQRVENEIPVVLRETTDADKGHSDSVKTAYLAQLFVRAAQNMDSLKKLIADRREARAVVDRCSTLSDSVKRELHQNDRYVTFETNHKFDTLVGDLTALAREVKQPTGDWASLRTRAEGIETGFRQVRQAIADGRANYDGANEAVRRLRTAIDAIGISHTFMVTEPTRAKVRGLDDTYGRLHQTMNGNKHDWSKVKQEAAAAVDEAVEAKKWFDEDSLRWNALHAHEEVYGYSINLNVYSRTVNGRQYNGGHVVANNDPGFIAHRQAGHQHISNARHFWSRREWFGVDQEVGNLAREYKALNLIGWWSVLQMMRDSNDFAAQHYAFQGGFRDNVTWETWRDKFISKQRLNANGLWEPVSVEEWLRTGAGGADFTKAPDFAGYGGTDPWTPLTPTT